jgi:hypothetical protein
MITPPELRQQARRLLADARRARNNAEKKLLLELAAKVLETAAKLEREESEGELDLVPLLQEVGFKRRRIKLRF